MALNTLQGSRDEDQGWCWRTWGTKQRLGTLEAATASALGWCAEALGGKGLNRCAFSRTPELHYKPGEKGFKRGRQQQVSSPGAGKELMMLSTLHCSSILTLGARSPLAVPIPWGFPALLGAAISHSFLWFSDGCKRDLRELPTPHITKTACVPAPLFFFSQQLVTSEQL